MTHTNIQSAFYATGIFQIDMHVCKDHDFMPSSVTGRPDPTTPLDPIQSLARVAAS